MTLFVFGYLFFKFCTFFLVNVFFLNADICVTKTKNIREIVPKMKWLWCRPRSSPTFCYKVFVPISVFVTGVFNSDK